MFLKRQNPFSFKKYGRTTLYKLFWKMGYKYYHSKQIIRSELVNKINNKR